MIKSQLDPITLEVLRHRLWMINDEQGRVASQISGSPVVYESKDFNASLLTPDGRSLFVGVYTTRISLCLEAAVKWVQEHYQENPGISDGDAFVTNDPWAGAAHQNDMLMVAPIFVEDRLVAWTGVAMHEVDVGGPNPGSFTVGSKTVFGEGPLISPIKLVERGKMRADVERLVIRNSRTSELNALDLRARMAAIHRTRQRILETVQEYGVETLLQAEEEILLLAQEAFRRRLLSLPDGEWRDEGFIDHDGNENRLYRFSVTLTKIKDQIKFDFRGTDPQALGSINCTRVGLDSGVLSAILPMLCYDISWSPGALLPLIEIISEPGTVNHAIHPAGVSMATVAATFATQHVAAGAIAKMLACSPLVDEVQANWCPAWQGMTLAGYHENGKPFTAVLLDQAGGGGGRVHKDGPDTSGLPGSPAQGIANVETYEQSYPILYVYRKQSADTGGPGLNRGGVGLEALMISHRSQGPIDMTLLTHGGSQPEARGLAGGYPGSIQARVLLKNSGIHQQFKNGKVPADWRIVKAEEIVPIESKARLMLEVEDAILVVSSGGGGYGDPLKREISQVERDVRRGLVSVGVAKDIFGVIPGNFQDTASLREQIRAERLAKGIPVSSEPIAISSQGSASGAPIMAITSLDVTKDAQGNLNWSCPDCGYSYGSLDHDPKLAALQSEVAMDRISPWNQFGNPESSIIREIYCPGCGSMLAVEVRRRGDPVLLDMALIR